MIENSSAITAVLCDQLCDCCVHLMHYSSQLADLAAQQQSKCSIQTKSRGRTGIPIRVLPASEAQLDMLLDVVSVWLLDVCSLQRTDTECPKGLQYSCCPELRSCLGMSRISCRVQSNPTLSCRQPGTFVHAHRREGYRMTYQAYNKHPNTQTPALVHCYQVLHHPHAHTRVLFL